jgi:hypothetical protein
MKCATHGLKDRDGRELSIVEPHVNIGASLSFERRGFLVQRLKRMGGAPPNSRNVAELSGRRLVAQYHHFRRILSIVFPCASLSTSLSK